MKKRTPTPATALGRALVVSLLVAVLPPRATAAQPAAEKGGNAMTVTITSSSFGDHGEIPRECTCQGGDVSPPLAWAGIPTTAKSLVLIVDDPDAPDPRAPAMTWVHWVLYNIPATATAIARGGSVGGLPEGTREGLNSWKRTGYGGPCPPIGRHRYFHKLYALDTLLPDLGEPTAAALQKAMQGRVVGEAQLIGTYQKTE